MKFDIKMDLRRKAKLVAEGHVTKDIEGDNYSGIIKMDSIRLIFLLADLNKMDLLMADVSNAYLNAYTNEKIYTKCGPEFGNDLCGK
jgi:trans-2-enoyl-CoA reductase